MTVVVAYRAYGIPMLLGDGLITAEGQDDKFSRKLKTIGTNLAIGWTGYKVTATRVQRDLLSALPPGGAVTREWLEGCLCSYHSGEFSPLDIILVGWLIDEGEHCFLWRSDWPHVVFWGDVMFDDAGLPYQSPIVEGSGEVFFKRLFNERGLCSSDDPNAVSRQDAICASLEMATIGTGNHIEKGNYIRSLKAGGFYEFLEWTGSTFRFVDNRTDL